MSHLMSHLVSHPVVNAVAWTLVHFLWQGAVIGVAAAAMWRIFRRASPHVRYGIGVAALAVMVVSVAVTLTRIVHAQRSGVASAPIAQAVSTVASPSHLPSLGLTATVVGSAATTVVRDVAPKATDRSSTWLAIFFVLWTAGVCVSLVRLAGGWMIALRLTRRGVAPVAADLAVLANRLKARLGLHRAVRVLESSLVHVPTVVGWLKPVVLLPTATIIGLPASALEALIAHELAHIRRHDYAVNLLQALVEAVLFYHPAVWIVSRRVRMEREHCCDDVAIDVCGDPAGYAAALASLEALRTTPSLALAASGGSLVDRVRRILNPAPASPGTMSASMGVSFIVLVIAALSPVMLASRHAEERSKPALADHGASASAHADIAAAAPLEVQTPPKPDTYKIKSGDVLHVVVDGDAERSRDYTVESDGVILLVLTRPIKAAGATATDLANTVARTLTSASGAHLDPAIMATQVTTMQVRLDYATQQRELAEAKYTRLKALNLDDARAAYDRDIAKDGQVLALQREIAKFQDQYDSNWAAGMRDHNDVMKGLTSMITAKKAELRDTMSRIVVAALEELNAARAVESRAANTLANVRNAAATSAASAATPRVTVTVRKKSATGAAEAESPVVPEAQTPPPASQPGAVADYRVGSQDVIQVDVLTPILRSLLPDGQYHIEADGAIRFPQVKDPVKIEGLTCREIEQRLKDVLRDAGVFDGAQFRVTVAQFRSQTVTFLGQGVKAVGPVTLGGNEVRLTAGLAQAGLQPEAANTIKIVHADGTETIVDRAEMESGHVDPILRTGDKIIVDKAPSIILDGEGVVRQGPVKWEPGLTVDQAVQRSGGYTKVAAKGSVTVWWIDDKGKKQTKDLKEEEIYTYVLKADDHVTIPKRIMGSSIP